MITEKDIEDYKVLKSKIYNRAYEVISLVYKFFNVKLRSVEINHFVFEELFLPKHLSFAASTSDYSFKTSQKLRTKQYSYCEAIPSSFLFMSDSEIIEILQKEKEERDLEEEMKKTKEEKLIQSAMKKLSKEEIKALGIKVNV